jgi:RNA polymerase sigma-70 factor (ECF subfamily)
MVAVHSDPRLAVRMDPSDVVQETVVEASRKLPGYLRGRPMPFYPWLRRTAWERSVHLHTRRLSTQTRTVAPEDLGLL